MILDIISKSSIKFNLYTIIDNTKIMNINNNPYKMPKLDFTLSSFKPYISESTLNIHYNVLHANYVNRVNLLLEVDETIANIFKNRDNFFESVNKLKFIKKNHQMFIKNHIIFRNAILGHINHNFLWKTLNNNSNSLISNESIYKQITKDFGTIEHFQNELINNVCDHFSNGWGWLVWNNKIMKLKIMTTSLHNNPLFISRNLLPIICFDLWEHAYIIDYGIKGLRKQYIIDMFNFINWDVANILFKDIIKLKNNQNIQMYFYNWLDL